MNNLIRDKEYYIVKLYEDKLLVDYGKFKTSIPKMMIHLNVCKQLVGDQYFYFEAPNKETISTEDTSMVFENWGDVKEYSDTAKFQLYLSLDAALSLQNKE